MDEIIQYLKNEYQPLAIVLYGSYVDGTNDEYSDFDCMLIVKDKVKKHDDSIISGVQLDCFIYSEEDIEKEDADLFLTVYDGEILFDKDGLAANLKKRVREYVKDHATIEDDEKKFIISWVRKTMYRVKKNDDEGNYRALAFLWESLSDYFMLRDLFYFGSKKAVAFLKERDMAGYHLYHKAITEKTNEAIALWAEYVINIEV